MGAGGLVSLCMGALSCGGKPKWGVAGSIFGGSVWMWTLAVTAFGAAASGGSFPLLPTSTVLDPYNSVSMAIRGVAYSFVALAIGVAAMRTLQLNITEINETAWCFGFALSFVFLIDSASSFAFRHTPGVC